MAGSPSEEALRAKTEAVMRRRYPEARIVHELVLDQGGVRIDLAAVLPDRLIAAEIKSERDTLKRLKAQVEVALCVAQDVWVVLAPKHHAALIAGEAQQRRLLTGFEPMPRMPGATRGVYVDNPAFVPGLDRCWVYIETGEGIALDDRRLGLRLYNRHGRRPTPQAMLDMLWADELRAMRLGDARDDRETMIRRAIEHHSGAEIRRGVCAALRRRIFPRADAPDPAAPAARPVPLRAEAIL